MLVPPAPLASRCGCFRTSDEQPPKMENRETAAASAEQVEHAQMSLGSAPSAKLHCDACRETRNRERTVQRVRVKVRASESPPSFDSALGWRSMRTEIVSSVAGEGG
jgi:hypothetical protein